MAMTMPEFYAARKAFERFHGAGKPDAPSDEDFWAAVEASPDRPSIH